MIPSKIEIKILALRRIFAALGTKGLIKAPTHYTSHEPSHEPVRVVCWHVRADPRAERPGSC